MSFILYNANKFLAEHGYPINQDKPIYFLQIINETNLEVTINKIRDICLRASRLLPKNKYYCAKSSSQIAGFFIRYELAIEFKSRNQTSNSNFSHNKDFYSAFQIKTISDLPETLKNYLIPALTKKGENSLHNKIIEICKSLTSHNLNSQTISTNPTKTTQDFSNINLNISFSSQPTISQNRRVDSEKSLMANHANNSSLLPVENNRLSIPQKSEEMKPLIEKFNAYANHLITHAKEKERTANSIHALHQQGFINSSFSKRQKIEQVAKDNNFNPDYPYSQPDC